MGTNCIQLILKVTHQNKINTLQRMCIMSVLYFGQLCIIVTNKHSNSNQIYVCIFMLLLLSLVVKSKHFRKIIILA